MKTVLCEINNSVATVTMNRPERLNALNEELARELCTTMKKLAKDDSVRAVVLHGAGPSFMAGGDLVEFKGQKEAGASNEQWHRLFEMAHGVIKAISKMPKPVIAAVHGAAAGYGLSLMSACDLAVAAEDSFFTLAYCHVGVSPDGGATYTLPRTIGMKKTAELMLLGDRYSAADIEAMGLLNRVTPKGEALAEALKLASRTAEGPALANARGKELLALSGGSTLEEQLDAEQERFIECTMSADFDEGLAAFLERRKPNFGKS